MNYRDPAITGSNFDRLPNDAYFSRDDMLVDGLARHLPLNLLRVFEPCAGEGHLMWRLEHHGARIVAACDLFPYPGQDIRIRTGINFLTHRLPRDTKANAIVMNPPFKEITPFIRHALRIMPEGWVIVLARHEWMTAKGIKDGRRELLTSPRFYASAPIIGRPSWHKVTTTKARHTYAWYLWGTPGHNGPYLWI